MAIIRQYDNNVDKRLGLVEFDRLVQDVQRFRAEKGLTSELDAQIKRAFEHFDFDGSGDINAMELRCTFEYSTRTSHRSWSREGKPYSLPRLIPPPTKPITSTITITRARRLAHTAHMRACALPAHAPHTPPHTTPPLSPLHASDAHLPPLVASLPSPRRRYALEKLGVKASTEDALAVLKAYDADTTRRLGFEEFAKLVRDVIRCSSQDEIDERVRRIFEQFDRDRSGDMNATELRAALAALGVPTEALSRASSLLAIYDADGSVRLSVHEFSRLHDDILRHNYGSYAAIQPALLQRETARLFRAHRREDRSLRIRLR